MSNIVELTAGNLAFGPQDIDAMSAALEAVCKVLNIPDSATARELIALRIIDFALSRRTKLRRIAGAPAS